MPRVRINDTDLDVERDCRLRDLMVQAALAMPCGGNGICGKCKVKVVGAVSEMTEVEKLHLTEEEVSSGIRLACFTRVVGDCTVTIPTSLSADICVTSHTDQNVTRSATFRYGAAVDIGTTTVAAALYSGEGRRLATATAINPQVSFGADVLSRAQAAEQGKRAILAQLIRGCVSDLLQQMVTAARIQESEIDTVVVTGNTAMLCLLTETSVEHLITAPFFCERLFGETLSADECGLQGLSADAMVYLPRCIDAFLGADLVCAIIATSLCDHKETALLVDVGTNGEMALWHSGQLYVCSTAAGPAFEGVGISCGMIATEGAIDHVDIVNSKLLPHIIGGGTARGVCGSGLIDAVACLLDIEEIDVTGHMEVDECTLIDDVRLSREDIRVLLVSKSAVRSGIETLLFAAHATPEDVKTVYLAGGFGNTLNLYRAARIGMIPKEFARKTELIGNAALGGAIRLLFTKEKDRDMDSIIKANKVELATNPYFTDAFIRNMLFE